MSIREILKLLPPSMIKQMGGMESIQRMMKKLGGMSGFNGNLGGNKL